MFYFNGVAIKEWINIYEAVIEFIQIIIQYNIYIHLTLDMKHGNSGFWYGDMTGFNVCP